MEYLKANVINKKNTTGIIEVDETKLLDSNQFSTTKPEIRSSLEFKFRGYYLGNRFDWIICKDSDNMLCLVPINK